jgi:hypothetical protein
VAKTKGQNADAFTVSEPLMRVAVQAAAFFELCPDDVLDPGLAVKQLEWISSELQRLDSDLSDALSSRAASRTPSSRP